MSEPLIGPTLEAPLAFPELDASDASRLVAAVRDGLPIERFDALQAALGVPAATLADVLGLSPSTLRRRRRRGAFEMPESERLVRIGMLVRRAAEVFGTLELARAWLTEPAHGLGGAVPLRFASVEPGAREVERLLGRIEHGVFS